MNRAYYSNTIKVFLNDLESSILGKLTMNHANRSLEDLQINAWRKQIQILKNQLQDVKFHHVIPSQKQYLETHLVKS